MLACSGDYTIIINKARIFITNRLQNYFAMINRNHNPDKSYQVSAAPSILANENILSETYNYIKPVGPESCQATFLDLLILFILVTGQVDVFSSNMTLSVTVPPL